MADKWFVKEWVEDRCYFLLATRYLLSTLLCESLCFSFLCGEKKPTAACFLRCPALWFAGCQCPHPGRLWYRFASWLSHHYYLLCQYLQDLHPHWRCLSPSFLHPYLLAGRRRNCKAIKPILLLEIRFSLLSVLLLKNPVATAGI
jgi:hypothetical protein